jgi:transketolase N-terminal domain/subunit/spore coat polysaccharide biosynthesis protein SpsF (cytidylyltransferase family)
MNTTERKIVTIIQVRRGSSRLPDKVFRPLSGKSLFVRQVERVRASGLCGQVVVATTLDPADDLVAAACEQEGWECFRGHGTDLLDRHYQAALIYGADTVIKIPGDCPLIDPAIIDGVIGFYQENADRYDYVSNLHPATYPDGNDVEIMSFQTLENAWKNAARPFEREHTTPYIWERPDQFRIGNVVMEGGVDYSMTHRLTIDYEEDYLFIKAVWEELYPINPLFTVGDILALMERRPDIYRINHSLAGVNWYRNHLDELTTVAAGQTKFAAGELNGGPLAVIALKVREHIIRMSAGGGCFIGASLSCVELMVYLYADFLRLGQRKSDLAGGPEDDPKRDFLFLSKGHDVPALYGTFVEMGLLEADRLKNHLSTSDNIYWHPNRAIPGVEFHSGSLGHLPAVAAGVALDCQLKGLDNRVVVITGDGELNEGSVWEAILVANAYKLGNLTIVVDRNQFQANIRTEDLVPLEPLADKFRAFGCQVQRIDGHDFTQLQKAFGTIGGDKVNVIIADTVRGKGLPSIEARADRWFCSFSDKEVAQLLEELHGNTKATIESETLVVR